MASLSTALTIDFYKPFWGKGADEARCVRVSRQSFLVFGLLFMVFALVLHNLDNLLWLAFRLIAFTYGPLLGIFIVAILTEWRVSSRRLLPAMFAWTIGSFTLSMLAWQVATAAGHPAAPGGFLAAVGAHPGLASFLVKLHKDYWRLYSVLGALLMPAWAYLVREPE